MTVFYANTPDGLPLGSSTAGAPIQATGKSQNSRRRAYASSVTLATQTTSDTIVIAKPNSNELFTGCTINISATLGSSTLALTWRKLDGTVVTLSAAVTYTSANSNIEMVVTNANLFQEMDGGEIYLVIAAASLPASGTAKFIVHTIGY